MPKFISEAPKIWELLNGVVCLYKPAGQTASHVRQIFLNKLCQELNSLDVRPPRQYVAIEGKTTQENFMTVRPSFADDPLVVGPRYQTQDFKAIWAHDLGFNTSGVLAIGLNKGTKRAFVIDKWHPLRTYRLKGTLGYTTDNMFATGKVVGETRFRHVRRGAIERHLTRMEASHQRLAYESAGIDPQSQEAYELAVKGLVRPQDHRTPIIYNAKCISFEPPNFTIEISCINEYESYLLAQVHDIGLRVHSAATCTFIQCIHHSFFHLEDALLMKHWNLENVLANMANTKRKMRRQGELSQNLNKYVARKS